MMSLLFLWLARLDGATRPRHGSPTQVANAAAARAQGVRAEDLRKGPPLLPARRPKLEKRSSGGLLGLQPVEGFLLLLLLGTALLADDADLAPVFEAFPLHAARRAFFPQTAPHRKRAGLCARWYILSVAFEAATPIDVVAAAFAAPARKEAASLLETVAGELRCYYCSW